ncbi:MAG: sensor histidine kinase, partial [Ardenticatenaceae bacterium]
LVDEGARYDPQSEHHLFRILQQALENALRHAQAQSISLYGCLQPERIDITVEDDGIGFPAGEQPNLAAFLARQHFGLATMFERAALIGARIEITPSPRGTRVRAQWRTTQPRQGPEPEIGSQSDGWDSPD